jgi:hypothetical protein
MNIKKAKEILMLILNPDHYQPCTPFIMGLPGVGKSDIVKQVAQFYHMEIIDLRMSQHDSTDIKGLPFNSEDGKTCKWLPPDFLPYKGSKWDGTKGILFFDEINRATPETQQSIFQVVWDRKVGEKEILKEWKIVAAGNFGYEDNTDVFDIDPALRNRFIPFIEIYKEDILISDWLEWAESVNLNTYISGFLKQKPEYLYYNTDDKDKNILVTPRTWEKFATILDLNKGKEKEIIMLMGKSIIYSILPPFFNYLDKRLTVSALDILNKYDTIQNQLSVLERQDIYALINSLVELIKQDTKKYCAKKYVDNFRKFFNANLNDDNKVALLKELIDNADSFLQKFFQLDNSANDATSEINILLRKSIPL